ASSTIVRHNILQHHIPAGCMVRRHPDDKWAPLERTREFADLVGTNSVRETPRERRPRELPVAVSPSTGVASRLDPQLLRTVGIRGVLQELLGALDTTLTRRKLKVASVVGLVIGALLLTAQALAEQPSLRPMVWPVGGVLLLLVTSAGMGLVARMTFIELS